MKTRILLTVTAVCISSIGCGDATFDNPLADQDFVYSPKLIQVCIEKAAATKQVRIKQAFSNVTGEGLREAFCHYFADLWLGRDLDRMNTELLEIFTSKDPAVQQKFRLNEHYCLVINQQF